MTNNNEELKPCQECGGTGREDKMPDVIYCCYATQHYTKKPNKNQNIKYVRADTRAAESVDVEGLKKEVAQKITFDCIAHVPLYGESNVDTINNWNTHQIIEGANRAIHFLAEQGYLAQPKEQNERLEGWINAYDTYVREVIKDIEGFEKWRKQALKESE